MNQKRSPLNNAHTWSMNMKTRTHSVKNNNMFIQKFKIRSLSEDLYNLKIQREDPDLDLNDLEFFLDGQQLIQLIDEARRALL
jgi:hypothetical protein